MYDPSYSVNGNGKAHSPFLGSSHSGCTRGVADGGYEVVEDMAVDLSQYMDCSVVDSEFLSEYCQHNMQVSSSYSSLILRHTFRNVLNKWIIFS